MGELKIFILGAGGFAHELKAYYEQNTKIKPTLISPKEMKLYYDFVSAQHCWTILGSGKIDIKKRMLAEAKGSFASFIHPKSVVCTSEIGVGTVIAPGSVVAPNTKIGNHVLINYGATIGHDSTIGDLSVISPNASIGGNCSIGNEVYVGAGAMVRENLKIADNVTIGMGAVVTKDVLEPGVTVVGIPARKIDKS